MGRRILFGPVAVLLIALLAAPAVGADDKDDKKKTSDSSEKKSKLEKLTDGMDKAEGMWTLYHNEQKLYALLKRSDMNKEYIVLTSIARGVSRNYILGGMTWGEDVLWTFKKVGDKVHVIRRNVRFKARPGTPEAEAVQMAYSDSVLYALPVLTSASGGYLVDMTRIFMSDDPRIGRYIGGRFASDRSTWAKVKAFRENVELQVAAVYAGSRELETVPDPGGTQVHVHYSISELPETSYKPRIADDRVGYFVTAIKDFSSKGNDEHFIRYINRWDLRKDEPNADLSPPVKPIKFYIEKTVPVELRPYVRSGIEEWNKAFRKLGFDHAIEVEIQADDADWDPENINYNTFRWITAEAGFAMGPSRVNPKTGEILDADIIFDASFLRYWKQDYETFTPEEARTLLTGETPHEDLPGPVRRFHKQHPGAHCAYGEGMQQQMGFAAAALSVRGLTAEKGKLPDEFVHQALKEVVMHEVGHTLGLRHNFKASSWKPLEAIDDAEDGATVASVMDYVPANIAADKDEQGLYYPSTIGPYDHWAIEYGYKPISGNERKELDKIASRCTEPAHHYATDEDTGSFSSDPLANRFDLGADPTEFAERQMKISRELMPKVVERSVEEGDGYQRARQAFGLLFSEYWRTALFASRFPGGIYVHRDHKGDPNQRPPFEIVDADKQRKAMQFLAKTALAAPEYEPDVLNYLAPTRWTHWGMSSYSRLDYPIHEYVAMMQRMILGQLLSPRTLSRLHDGELKVPADEEAYTLAEHLRALVESIFAEWQDVPQPPEQAGPAVAGKPGERASGGGYTNRDPYISSFRRNLQRMALKELAGMVTSGRGVPEDARTLGRMHLQELDRRVERILHKDMNDENVNLDDYSRAHLLDSQKRIRQVLNAELEVRSIQ